MHVTDKIFVEERRRQILRLLEKNKRITLVELAEYFNVTDITLRRDLSELETRGTLRRTYGGAILPDYTSKELSFIERESRNHEEKERIARFVAQIVKNGETIILDAGSTTHLISQMLSNKQDLIVVSNSSVLGPEFVGINRNRVVFTGGTLNAMTNAMTGSVAKHTLLGYMADKVILGISSIDPEQGLFTVNHYEADIKRAMIKCGKEIIVAADSSKINTLSFSFVTDFESINKLVIDDGITKEHIRIIEDKGVEVITV